MPIIKSAKKRVKIAAKAKVRNNRTRRDLREALKAFAAALESGKSDKINQAQSAATKAIDIAVKKNVIHKNKASRQKARLAKQSKDAGVKIISLKTSLKPKKTASKKKPAKTKK